MGMANHHFFLVNTITIGGVSHFFYVHSLFGEMIQFDLRIFFQMGRFNHQLDQNGSHRIHGFGIFPYIYYHSCRKKKYYYIYIPATSHGFGMGWLCFPTQLRRFKTVRPSAEDRAGVATHCWFQDGKPWIFHDRSWLRFFLNRSPNLTDRFWWDVPKGIFFMLHVGWLNL